MHASAALEETGPRPATRSIRITPVSAAHVPPNHEPHASQLALRWLREACPRHLESKIWERTGHLAATIRFAGDMQRFGQAGCRTGTQIRIDPDKRGRASSHSGHQIATYRLRRLISTPVLSLSIALELMPPALFVTTRPRICYERQLPVDMRILLEAKVSATLVEASTCEIRKYLPAQKTERRPRSLDRLFSVHCV